MSRLLSLAAGTILDVGPVDAVDVAADAGFGAVGIWFDPTGFGVETPGKIRTRLDDRGIIALDIEPIMLSSSGDHGDRIVDAAIEIGVHNILVASREGDHAKVATRLTALSDRVAGSQIKLVLEFLPILAIKTLADAVSIARSVSRENVGVLIDALHLSRSHSSLDLVRQTNVKMFPYLQLCDAPEVHPDPSPENLLYEALHSRLLPGDGGLPLVELLEAVPDVPISLELRSAALIEAFPDPRDRARAVHAAMTTVLRKTS